MKHRWSCPSLNLQRYQMNQRTYGPTSKRQDRYKWHWQEWRSPVPFWARDQAPSLPVSGLEYSRHRISESWASTFSISLRDCNSCTLQRWGGRRSLPGFRDRDSPCFLCDHFSPNLFPNLFLFIFELLAFKKSCDEYREFPYFLYPSFPNVNIIHKNSSITKTTKSTLVQYY